MIHEPGSSGVPHSSVCPQCNQVVGLKIESSDENSSKKDDFHIQSPYIVVSAFIAITNIWARYFSFSGLPRGDRVTESEIRRQNRHDIFHLTLFAMSLLVLCNFTSSALTSFHRLLFVVAIFRIIDLSVKGLRLGVIGFFIHNIRLWERSREQIQRDILMTLLSYLQALVWFAIVYLYIGLNSVDQFNVIVSAPKQAFLLSMSTQTTAGYGLVAPIEATALFFATWQAVYGVIVPVHARSTGAVVIPMR